MKLNRDDAVAMCVALDFKTAKTWNKKRMRKKLVEIARMAEEGDGLTIEEGEDAERLDVILQAVLAAGGEVEIVVNEETLLFEGPTDDEVAKASDDDDSDVDDSDEEPELLPDEVEPETLESEVTEGEPEPADDDTQAPAEEVDSIPQESLKKRGRPKGSKNKTKAAGGETDEKEKPVKGPSNKEKVYRLYEKSESKVPKEVAEGFHSAVNGVVKLSTIRGWVSMWNHGNGLPGCVKKEK